MSDLLSRWVIFQSYYPAISVVLMCALKSTAILFAGWIVAGFLGGRSAAARCWLWRVVLVACLVLPLFDFGPAALKRLRLVWPQQTSAESYHAFGEQAQAWRLMRSDDEISAIRHQLTSERLKVARDLAPWERERIESEPFLIDDIRPAPWRQIESNVYKTWWLVFGVLMGVLVLRVTVSSWRLIKNARAVTDDLRIEAAAVAERLGIKRDVRVKLLGGTRSPLMAGWLRPSIYLPESSADWNFSSREAVFLHELAHWKRGDHFWQLAGRICSTVFWWQPLVAWAMRRMNAEAEEAADDVVLLQKASADTYARTLVAIASGVGLKLPAVGIPMVGYRALEKRIGALLRDNPWRGRVGRLAAMIIVVSGAGALAGASFYVGQAASAESITAPQDPKVLSEQDRVLLKRIEGNMLRRLAAMRYLHFALEERQDRKQAGKAWRSPQPSRMEAWVDEWTGVHRAEYRPRVLVSLDNAGDFSIKEETAINDGKEYFSYDEDDEIDRVRPQKPQGLEYYLGHEEVTDLLRVIRSMLSGGNLVGVNINFSLEQIQWQERAVWQLRQQFTESGKVNQQRIFLVDPSNEDVLVFSELTFPGRNPDGKSQWIAQEFRRSPAGILYPARYQRVNERKDYSSTDEVRVIKLDVLDGLPAGVAKRPQSPDAPYLSTTGKPVVHTQLAVDYVHAEEPGRALPAVTVVMRVNSSRSVELHPDSQGRLIIPLPSEEITYLEVRAKAAGFAPQVVRWRKQGDPLKLPDHYSAKLWPSSPVSGKVVDESGQPVAGAEVQLSLRGVGRGNYVFGDFFDISGLNVRTGSDGIWTSKVFPDDLRGLSYRISASGYLATTDSGSADFRSFAKVPYSALRDGSWVVTLRKGVSLSGIVSDHSGAPVSGARLVVGRDAWGTNLPVVNADARGVFDLKGLGTGHIILTVEAPLHKPQSMDLKLPLAEPLLVRLDKGNVLRGRVVDAKGKPCAGLNVGVDTWKDLRTLNFTTQTDGDGRFEWRGAPDEPVSFGFGGCQNREFLSGLWLKAGDSDEQIVVMKPALRLNTKVIDAVTKLPIKSFRLTSGRVYDGGGPYWDKTSSKSYENGPGVWETGYMGGRLAFLVEAEGYEPFQTPAYETDQTEKTATYELKPVSGKIAGVVKGSD